MGCHCADTAFWALDLADPTLIEAEATGTHPDSAPKASIVRYEFPARKGRPPVKFIWYDGGNLPPRDLFRGEKPTLNGSLLVGSKGTAFLQDWNPDKYLLLPKNEFVGFEGPAQTIPRSPGHYLEWIAACKGGPRALSNFDYASTMTEALLLGNVALRKGGRIEWDARRMEIKGDPSGDLFIRPEYRKGWEI
jgi:hypothetical protein